MRLLPLLIDLLVLGNFALFLLVFSLLSPPQGVLQSFVRRFQDPEDPVYPEDAAEQMVRNMLRFYGYMAGCLLFGWTALTTFVVSLHVDGTLPTFIRSVLK